MAKNVSKWEAKSSNILLLLLDVPNGILDDPNGKREMMDIIIILGFSQAWSLSADFSCVVVVYSSTAAVCILYYTAVQPARG